MATCTHINFAQTNRIPKWVRDLYTAEYYYHQSLLDDFVMVVDPKRFAGGFAWLCRKCLKPAYTMEEVGQLTGKVVARAVFCPFCWVGYRAPDTELMWVRILMDWQDGKPSAEPIETLRVLH